MIARGRIYRRRMRLLPVLVWSSLVTACSGEPESPANPPAQQPPPEPPAARITVAAAAGLATPECALHDELADVYLVSNIQGTPFDKDDNGFISRITPSGRVAELKWIDGAAGDVTLHAPKGMAISGDSLFVCDIDVVRRFDRISGKLRAEIPIPNASFLNGIAVDAQGVLWVTDTGVAPDFSPNGNDSVHRIDADGRVTKVASGPDLAGPNGIAATQNGVLFVNWHRGELRRVARDGTSPVVATLPAAQLDGLVELADGTLLVSGWGGSCVYAVTPAGQVTTKIPDLPQPAAIGIDRRRQRVLVPLFGANQLEFLPL